MGTLTGVMSEEWGSYERLRGEGYEQPKLRTLRHRCTLGSRGYYFLMDTDGSRRSRVNEKKNPLEPRVTQAPTLGASKKDGGGSEVRFAPYVRTETSKKLSLVPRPVHAIRVTRGGLQPSAIAR